MINILSDETINKIAAGEVVERPLSVVKELVENSIDAGASAISVEIKDGGISFIRITDNGCGIPENEVRKAFLRHATSKIESADDLLCVSSLGFRGEALASIAAVSKCELITRTKDEISGSRYLIEGGKEILFNEIGAPIGTTFIIRDLFANVPARRKFLKSAGTEGSYIVNAVSKIALAHPEVSIRLTANNDIKIHTTGSGKLKEVIYSLYGREITNDIIEINASDDTFSVYGYIGKPLLSRGNRSYEIFEVNGRTINSNLLCSALEDAYHGFVMQHKYPFAILSLNVPSELIDVNVHPAKLEVRFSDEGSVYDFLKNAVSDVLYHKEIITEAKIEDEKPSVKEEAPKTKAPEPFETVRIFNENTESKEADYNIPEEIILTDNKTETLKEDPVISQFTPGKFIQEELPVGRILSKESATDFKLIGSIFDTYLLIEYKDDFLMIDQHAAHEKVLYERTMKALENKEQTCQMLNPPIIISLNEREIQVLNENTDSFKRIGFEIESYGGKDYAVYGVPGNMMSIADKNLLMEMLDDLCMESKSSGRLIDEKVASLSCKAAVKGNMHLSTVEAEELIKELLSLEKPYTCPHGRPTAIKLSKTDIEKKFKRIV